MASSIDQTLADLINLAADIRESRVLLEEGRKKAEALIAPHGPMVTQPLASYFEFLLENT